MSTAHVAPGRPRDPGVDRRIAQAALDLFGDAGWAGHDARDEHAT